MKLTAVSLVCLFFAASAGSDICFGRLLERAYLIAPEDWRKDGGPTWWTWRPVDSHAPRWYYNAPRVRWLWNLPPYLEADGVARSLHVWHRLLAILAVSAWAAFIVLVMAGYFSR